MSDMKCPFCQQEMRRTNGTHNKVGVWQCQNYNDTDNVCIASGYLFNDDVLNYIIRTRKALDVAVKRLGYIKNNYKNWTPDRDELMIAQAANGLDEIKTILTKGGDNE